MNQMKLMIEVPRIYCSECDIVWTLAAVEQVVSLVAFNCRQLRCKDFCPSIRNPERVNINVEKGTSSMCLIHCNSH